MRVSLCYLLLSLFFWPLSLVAAGPDWSYCKPSPFLVGADQLAPAADDNAIRVSADALSNGDARSLLFEGEVTLQGQGKLLHADKVRVFETPRRFEAQGHIEMRSVGFVIRGDSAVLSEAERRGEVEDVEYALPQRHAFGRATRVVTTDDKLALEGASYSSCAPNNPDWEILSSRIKLDRAAGYGSARNARLEFFNVPLLYVPYITFPIDNQRRTGFLYPVLGSSDTSGVQLSTPFYWNLAPNYDATLTPNFMEKRGTMLQNEFRFLDKRTRSKLKLDYLDEDRIAGDPRYRYSIDSESRLGKHWRLELDGSVVSDNDYLTDFSSGLESTSLTHLDRHADLIYQSRHWQGLIRYQAYQTIDATIPLDERPYKRLPQVNFTGILPMRGGDHLSLSIDTDITRFSHSHAVEGRRVDIAPKLEYHWVTPAGFLRPAVSLHHSWYDIDAFGDSPGRRIERDVPVSSLDAGVVLEREMRSGRTLTLEPRTFYLYVPYRNQGDIPVFDSNEPAFIFSSLFRENRFSGLDRIGDANQLTTALTSRLFEDSSGREIFRASLGQIYYFEDRRVTLPGEAAQQGSRSNYLAEVSATPFEHWLASGHLVSESDLSQAEVATVSIGYRGENNRVANVEHRFRRTDDVNQTALSGAWPINRNWRFLGSWLFSHARDLDLEVIGGLEYESCCWKARILARRYILDEQEQYNNSFYVQLILKGLASFGTGNTLIKQSISGYDINDE